MRLDRAITLNVVRPVQRLLAASKDGDETRVGRECIPILMYHSICDAAESNGHPYYQTNTRPEVFARQMEYLAENGFQAITLKQAVECCTQVPAKGTRPVVITFDDGYRDFYTDAMPILRKHGFKATMFLSTAFIGEQRRRFNPRVERTGYFLGKECLAWREVRELHEAGIEFGSHTVNHPVLSDLPWPVIEYELRESKREIEDRLAEQVTSFVYPFAFPSSNRRFVAGFKELLVQEGYNCCATTELGRMRPADNWFTAKRLPMNSCDDEPLFRAKLEGNYDWLAGPQQVVKRLKSSRFVPSAIKSARKVRSPGFTRPRFS
jgi:peptidoglycan/xylan/chitin deacetylase (PgdA/CDA1 family)